MTLIQDDSKSTALVVEFVFLDGSLTAPTFNGASRFTDLASPISGFDPGEPDAQPDTLLKFKPQKFVPGMKEGLPVLTISDYHPLIKLMRREYTMPHVTCRVRQYFFDTSAGLTSVPVQIMFLAEGSVALAASAPSGEKGIVELTLETVKAKAKQPSGEAITPQCGNTFGVLKTCGVDVASLTETTGDITSITGNGFLVNITGLTVPNPNYWKNGFIYHEGVSMRIRDWDGATTFLLSQRVSYAMATASLPLSIQARPGCRLFQSDCRSYNNEARFKGLGAKIPTHHPLFEKGNG